MIILVFDIKIIFTLIIFYKFLNISIKIIKSREFKKLILLKIISKWEKMVIISKIKYFYCL